MEIRKLVGKNIVAEREAKNLTQLELSRMTGLATSSLREMEHGEVSPRVSSLDLICRALGTPLYTLFIEHADRDYSEPTVQHHPV